MFGRAGSADPIASSPVCVSCRDSLGSQGDSGWPLSHALPSIPASLRPGCSLVAPSGLEGRLTFPPLANRYASLFESW